MAEGGSHYCSKKTDDLCGRDYDEVINWLFVLSFVILVVLSLNYIVGFLFLPMFRFDLTCVVLLGLIVRGEKEYYYYLILNLQLFIN